MSGTAHDFRSFAQRIKDIQGKKRDVRRFQNIAARIKQDIRFALLFLGTVTFMRCAIL